MLSFDSACWQALLLLNASITLSGLPFTSSRGASELHQLLGPQLTVSPAQQCSCQPCLHRLAFSLFSFPFSLIFSSFLYVFPCPGNKADPLRLTPVTQRMLSLAELNLMNSSQATVLPEITALFNCSKPLLGVKGLTGGSVT